MDRHNSTIVDFMKREVLWGTNKFRSVMLYTVHNTVNKILKIRGYNVIHNGIDLSNISYEQFKRLYKTREDMQHTYDGKFTVMYLQYETKFGTDEMRSIVEYIYNIGVLKAMVITEIPPTAQAHKKINSIKPISIEFYCYTDLVFDIAEHALMRSSYKIVNVDPAKASKMKTISSTDPLVKVMGGNIGDVILMDDTIYRRITQ
jgi:hypothetical protein